MVLMSPLLEHVHCGVYNSKRLSETLKGFAKELKKNLKIKNNKKPK